MHGSPKLGQAQYVVVKSRLMQEQQLNESIKIRPISTKNGSTKHTETKTDIKEKRLVSLTTAEPAKKRPLPAMLTAELPLKVLPSCQDHSK